MKIAVIGNSHCGALISAWEEQSHRRQDVSLTFFAMPGHMGLRTLKIKGDALVPNTPRQRKILRRISGGLERIETGNFDRFLVYGLLKHPLPEEGDAHHSSALREAILQDRLHDSSAKFILKSLQSITDKPIDVGPAPYLVPSKKDPVAQWQSTPAQDSKFFSDGFKALGAERFIAQPEESLLIADTTQAPTRATDPRYSKGSIKIVTGGGVHPESDRKHMNAAYGALWLERYLADLPH